MSAFESGFIQEPQDKGMRDKDIFIYFTLKRKPIFQALNFKINILCIFGIFSEKKYAILIERSVFCESSESKSEY